MAYVRDVSSASATTNAMIPPVTPASARPTPSSQASTRKSRYNKTFDRKWLASSKKKSSRFSSPVAEQPPDPRHRSEAQRPEVPMLVSVPVPVPKPKLGSLDETWYVEHSGSPSRATPIDIGMASLSSQGLEPTDSALFGTTDFPSPSTTSATTKYEYSSAIAGASTTESYGYILRSSASTSPPTSHNRMSHFQTSTKPSLSISSQHSPSPLSSYNASPSHCVGEAYRLMPRGLVPSPNDGCIQSVMQSRPDGFTPSKEPEIHETEGDLASKPSKSTDETHSNTRKLLEEGKTRRQLKKVGTWFTS